MAVAPQRVLPRAIEHRPGLGIAMMLAANLGFAFIDTSVKWLALAGIGAWQLAFMRYVGAILISVALIGRGGFSLARFRTDRPGAVFLRALLLASSSLFNFYALRFLPLTVTSAIMFSAPIFVCALSPWLLAERVGPWRWGAIVLGFVGVLIVIRPFGASFHWAMALMVWNSLAMALYSILTRRLSGVVAAETMQLYTGALGTLLLMPMGLWTWTSPSTALDWLLLVGLGVWGWGGHELLTRAHGFASASVLMPFSYSFMLYLTLSSWLVFDHLPERWTLVGAAVIVVSGVIIWLRERRA